MHDERRYEFIMTSARYQSTFRKLSKRGNLIAAAFLNVTLLTVERNPGDRTKKSVGGYRVFLIALFLGNINVLRQ